MRSFRFAEKAIPHNEKTPWDLCDRYCQIEPHHPIDCEYRIGPPAPKYKYIKVPKEIRERVIHGGVCKICGASENLTVDHIIPRCYGGSNNIDNLQCLCGSCNSRKSGLNKDRRARW